MTDAERKLFEGEMIIWRDTFIASNVRGGHSVAVATAMVDRVLSEIRAAVESGRVAIRIIDGRFALNSADVDSFFAKHPPKPN